MTSKDYDEELKIDIANAMSKGELGNTRRRLLII